MITTSYFWRCKENNGKAGWWEGLIKCIPVVKEIH